MVNGHMLRSKSTYLEFINIIIGEDQKTKGVNVVKEVKSFASSVCSCEAY
jgi:hypothetical protein